ncbi:hypothetical protein N7533_008280 [Penicillium manginii]|uniref:uncharacterized protein n=1 Tax=Penicillium manginii TaxID=203109 RepID=UPI002547FD44|nr:uncharacterized protein N7533_011567 [Penicillium manginii]XP_056959887.1 uncharacterized protein N7533_008280 [Penicillium manginii]KAJ5742158.1 hypothetical protein N7533_011567 [Penicillium manginii]KAJ5751252.1 hypothetical protein N7533_008280 [Penicillium manginii]
MTKGEVDHVILKERGLTDNWMDHVTGPGTASTVMPQPGQPAPPTHSFDPFIAEQRQFYAPIQTTYRTPEPKGLQQPDDRAEPIQELTPPSVEWMPQQPDDHSEHTLPGVFPDDELPSLLSTPSHDRFPTGNPAAETEGVESYQSVDQLPEQSPQNFDSFTPEPLSDSPTRSAA